MNSILYSSTRSPHCLKAAMFLHEKGIEFKRVEIDLPKKEQKTPEYLRINPLGLVPAYEDDWGIHADSLLIMHYLEGRYPTPALFPKEPQAYKEGLQWIEQSSGPYRDVSHHLYWQLIEPPAAGTHWQRVSELKAQGMELLETLDMRLQKSEYVMGSFGVVDIALFPWVQGYRRFDLPPKGEFAAVVDWVERIMQRPSFKANYQQPGRPFFKEVR